MSKSTNDVERYNASVAGEFLGQDWVVHASHYDRVCQQLAEVERERDTLNQIITAKPRMDAFRSGGFVNHDYDMARISIDLPIIEATTLMSELRQQPQGGEDE